MPDLWPPRRLHFLPEAAADRRALNAALKPYWVAQRIASTPKSADLPDAYLAVTCVDNDTWDAVRDLGRQHGFEMVEG